MTMIEREEIFAKEYLSIKDFEQLYDVNYNMASVLMRDIKTRLTLGQGKELRINISGKLHIQDYLDFVGVSADRYSINKKDGEKGA